MSMVLGTILIVEDEENLGATLLESLAHFGAKVFWAQNVKDARELFYKEMPEIVLMDIGLPDGSGLTLAHELREKNRDFSLLFLSALNDPETKVKGLEIGAEDYITKPFALKELLLRLERINLFKKGVSNDRDGHTHGKIKISFKSYEIFDASGKGHPLNQKECSILKHLYEKEGLVVSRDELLDSVWGENADTSHRTIDNYIVKFRKVFDTDPLKKIEILSVRGAGYKLIINKN